MIRYCDDSVVCLSVRPSVCLSSSLMHSREVKIFLTSLLIVVEDRGVNYFWRVLRTIVNNNERTREMNSEYDDDEGIYFIVV